MTQLWVPALYLIQCGFQELRFGLEGVLCSGGFTASWDTSVWMSGVKFNFLFMRVGFSVLGPGLIFSSLYPISVLSET